MIDWGRLAARLDADGEFRVAARHWHATLRLDVGNESHSVSLEDGRVGAVANCDPGSKCDIYIGASQEVWEEMLAPAPRPFYQDLMAAQMHHGVAMNPDFLDFAAYYPALRRLIEVMREARHES